MELEQFESVADLVHSDLFSEWVFSKKHQQFWKNWQKAHPDKQNILMKAKKILQQLTFIKEEASVTEIDRALQNVWSIVKNPKMQISEPKKEIGPPKLLRSTYYKILRIAAVLLFLTIGGWLVYQYYASPFQEYETQFGQTQTLRLPDQSTVILQANSSLKVPKNWSKNQNREVWLDGEAFFSVTKSTINIPIKFVVHTTNFQVQVLGTQFDVLHRKENKRVVLQEGKVKIKLADNQEIELIPNEMVAYSPKAKKYQKTAVNSAIYIAWTQEKLILNNTPLSEISRILKENYGYQVNFSREVNQSQTRTSLGAIDIKDINNLIALIEASYEVKITKKGKRVLNID